MSDEDADKDLAKREEEPPPETKPEPKEAEIVSPEVQAKLQKLPPEVREIFFSAMKSGPVPHPIFEKLAPEHITEIIKQHGEQDKRGYDYNTCGRRYVFAGFLVVILLVVFVLVYFPLMGLQEYMPAVLAGLGGLAAGFAGGYGVGTLRRG